ncbi:hypothetical protein RH858_04080 [Halalkaliarchaeum sp. AArc-GB]|uniref:DUF7344 domain-containing protein n=1 Tax=Halalkaliarchaeum sp. AArc-GB TaxID=3074078 RepID=UPI00285F2BF7|nr:hypothetical protein [Halalkaliarchaeum sp. AArc-GB]MDR5672330.1 hypothetical protein [Halalkaliarchaeum sp. AArc-GB]
MNPGQQPQLDLQLSTTPVPSRRQLQAVGPSATSVTSAGSELSLDATFATLSNRRRRDVLRYLKGNPGETSVRTLSERIAAWENDVDVSEVTYRQRKRVYTSLHQTHLPKLAAGGFIEYEPHRGRVALTPAAAELDVYLETVGKHELPWSEYYLGLGAVSLATTVALALGALPAGIVTGTTLAAVVSLVLFVSALVHVASGRRMRLEDDTVDK